MLTDGSDDEEGDADGRTVVDVDGLALRDGEIDRDDIGNVDGVIVELAVGTQPSRNQTESNLHIQSFHSCHTC